MAPNPEIRTHPEGELRWVEASGTGIAVWQTASAVPTATSTAAWAPRSALIGYVQAGVGWDQVVNYTTIMDRGYPVHHKFANEQPSEVTFNILFGVTANIPSAVTSLGPSALGVSVVQYNFELKMRQSEIATASGIYYQFHKAIILRKPFSEAEAGNTLGFTVRALAVNGPTGSGYLG